MTREEGRAVLSDVFERLLQVKVDDLQDKLDLRMDLDIDSLDLVECVMELEDHVGAKIPEERLDGVMTVGDALDLLLSVA